MLCHNLYPNELKSEHSGKPKEKLIYVKKFFKIILLD